ncbi:MAG: TetR/AcrR family transcriptional regulator [Actinomycetota bacterium]
MTQPRRKLNARGRRTKRKIERTAIDLFASRGYEQVTVTEIAEQAGVSRRLFSHYFASKREVLFGDSDDYLARFVDMLFAAQSPDLADAFIEALVEFSRNFPRSEIDVLRAGILRSQPAAAALGRSWDAEWRSAVGSWVAVRIGSPPNSFETRTVAAALSALRQVVAEELYDSEGRADLEDLARRAFALVSFWNPSDPVS